MNKTKFFSSLLVAVLFATTSVFVSCKDYDDDIKNLQSQIDKAALKADLDALSTKLAGVESTANAAKTTAENALAKANANATEIAAVKATAEKAAKDAAAALAAVATAQTTAEAAQAAADGAKTLAENAQKAADAAQATANAAATKKDLEDAVKKVEDAAKALSDAAATKTELAEAKKELKEYTDAAEAAALKTAEAAATAAEKALTDAKGYTDAEVVKINDNIKTLATKEALGTLSKELNDEITGLKNTLAAITDEEKMAELVKIVGSFDAVVNTLFSAVTSVELISSYTGYIGNNITFDMQDGITVNPFTLDMTTGTIAENSVFGDEHSTFKGETYEFKAGDNIDFNDGVVVRISPVTADLAAANILLINSKGEGLDDYVEAGTPVRLEEMGALITRGTNIQSGLWFVPFSIKADVTEKEFAAATQVKVQNVPKNILYAVAVNNTAENDANRYAVSTYDVDPDYAEYEPVSTFGFTVDKKDIAKIRNRWTGVVAFSPETGETSEKYGMDAKELVWIDNDDDRTKKGLITPATEPGKYDENKAKSLTRLAEAGDDEVRTGWPMVPVEAAKPFTVAMYDGAQYEFQYYYVTLDERAFAVESDPSEWVAWNSYYPNIENLNKLIPAGQPVDITINDAKANGDIIGFRVYAVNYDGTLVDPDGRAFYVQVGEPGTTANGVATYYATKADYNFLATALDAKDNKSNTTGNASFTAQYKDRTYTNDPLTLTATGVVTIEQADFKQFLSGDLTVQYTLLKANGKDAATKWSEVAGAAIAVKNPGVQVDGSTVSFTLTAKDPSSDRVINSLTIGVKKELPTAELAIEWRATLAPVDGVLTVYPSPSDATLGAPAATGVQSIDYNTYPAQAGDPIIWPTSAELPAANVKTAIVDLAGYANDLDAETYDWIVKKVQKKSKNNDTDALVEGANNGGDYDNFIIDIDKNNINKTFDSEIYAVYEDVSLTKVDGAPEDYTITAWSGKIKFASLFSELVTYGNKGYNCFTNVAAANPNKASFMVNDYYYFYGQEGLIWKKIDGTTEDGNGTNNNKYKTLSDLTRIYVGNDIASPQALIDLFSATWKGNTAAETQESRLTGWNSGLQDPDNNTVDLLEYITFGTKAVVPGDAKTLINATVANDQLTIENRPGATCTSKVDDQIQITEAKDQFGATVPNLSLKLTIKPETAAYNDEKGL